VFVTARLAPVLALSLLAAAGCSKRKLPSEDFSRANEIHSQLYAKELDDAYLDPKMDEAVQLLQRVPPDSLDADSARQLLARIQSNRERVQAERTQREKAIAAASTPPPDTFGPRPSVAPPPDAGAPDAGPDLPKVGMSVDELSERFSRCFEPGQSMVVEGRGARDTWELKDIAICRDLYPGFDGLVLIIEDGKIWNYGQKSSIRTETIDAGTSAGADAGTSSAP
jgi:hypothetical protein